MATLCCCGGGGGGGGIGGGGGGTISWAQGQTVADAEDHKSFNWIKRFNSSVDSLNDFSNKFDPVLIWNISNELNWIFGKSIVMECFSFFFNIPTIKLN